MFFQWGECQRNPDVNAAEPRLGHAMHSARFVLDDAGEPLRDGFGEPMRGFHKLRLGKQGISRGSEPFVAERKLDKRMCICVGFHGCYSTS